VCALHDDAPFVLRSPVTSGQRHRSQRGLRHRGGAVRDPAGRRTTATALYAARFARGQTCPRIGHYQGTYALRCAEPAA
jgi:hypothetical protein